MSESSTTDRTRAQPEALRGRTLVASILARIFRLRDPDGFRLTISSEQPAT